MGVRLLALLALAAGVGMAVRAGRPEPPPPGVPAGIHKIRHVILIVQENRSFDAYFGTYPGADGIPRTPKGVPTVCVPDPRTGRCVRPYPDHQDMNAGGSHLA
jgi:phospholipase C